MDSIFKWYNSKEERLNVNKSGDVVYLSSPLYDKLAFINNGMSTRLGGVSTGPCSTMNLQYNGIDNDDCVTENYKIFCKETGININKIVKNKQTHSTNVIKIDTNYEFRNALLPGYDFEGYDGIITNVPDVTLFAFSSDCSIISIVDPENKAIGLCHSGWRGTAGKIGSKVIHMLHENYGSDPSKLLVTIWPSICQECFEVEWDMVEQAIQNFDKKYHSLMYYQKSEKKYQFNLWNANKIVLLESDIKEENIFMPNLCTKCNPDTLFSHRNTGFNRGNLVCFLAIKPGN